VSADQPDSKAAPSVRPPRPREAALATRLLGAAAFLLAFLLVLAPPLIALAGAVLCCLIGAAGCEIFARLGLPGPRGPEPWRLDAWALLVGGFALLALGVAVGPETKVLGWMLVALLGSLALSGFGSGRSR
jgi:hypothetical protein